VRQPSHVFPFAELIYPVGMYKQKAAGLIEISRQLERRFGGEVPTEIDDLTSLSGVGRKTANLVRTFAFGLPSICVDTHVHRITISFLSSALTLHSTF